MYGSADVLVRWVNRSSPGTTSLQRTPPHTTELTLHAAHVLSPLVSMAIVDLLMQQRHTDQILEITLKDRKAVTA